MMTQALNKKQKARNATQTPGANSEGVGSNTAQCRNQGIPPARIPEITKSSLHGMTFTLTL